MAMLNVYAPTGSYDKHRLVNMGRNHWAVEPMLGVTYLDETTGLEVSGAAGVTLNMQNPATHYFDYVTFPNPASAARCA
jgi:hypothetical protein